MHFEIFVYSSHKLCTLEDKVILMSAKIIINYETKGMFTIFTIILRITQQFKKKIFYDSLFLVTYLYVFKPIPQPQKEEYLLKVVCAPNKGPATLDRVK